VIENSQYYFMRLINYEGIWLVYISMYVTYSFDFGITNGSYTARPRLSLGTGTDVSHADEDIPM
jgi:hypothetical protein